MYLLIHCSKLLCAWEVGRGREEGRMRTHARMR